MKPIQDIGALYVGAVLYHSAFGFARVEKLEPGTVVLHWEREGGNLPGRVANDVITRVYAQCAQNGFFAQALDNQDELVELLAGSPVEALHLLLSDLHGVQARADIVDWLVGRELITPSAAEHWWAALRQVVAEDERFVLDEQGVRLAHASEPSGPLARLANPALSPARRLDLVLNHKAELPEADLLHHALLAARTGNAAVRDLAFMALREHPPSVLLRELLAPGPDGIEAILHALRKENWESTQIRTDVQAALLDRVVRGTDAGGPLDHEGRLAATLARWDTPGLTEMLTDLAATQDGTRTVRATFAALPPKRAELLALDMLECALDAEAHDTARWLSGEILSLALIDPRSLAARLADDRPELAIWFSQRYQVISPTAPHNADITDEHTVFTAELEFADTHDGPVPLSRMPARSGASILGLGLSLSRALHQHHKDGTVCNPSAHRLFFLPSEALELQAGSADDAPIPPHEAPSPTRDVYAAGVVLVEALLGRPWPSHIPAQRAIPYLRYVIPMLPPSAMAPLDAALHPDPRLRPQNGLAWQALWQAAAVAEETRLYAKRDVTARLALGYDSHIGRTKVLLTQTNQDSLFISTKGPLSMLVVCDGISTANAGSGDVASSIASHVMATLWEQALPRLVAAGPAEIRAFLDRALRMANQAVCEAAYRYAGGNLDGRIPMGTTAVVALVYGNHVWLAWLGDSRAYLCGSYGASLLTFDENQASERLRAWQLKLLDHWDPSGFALVGYLGHFDEMSRAEALTAHHTSFTLNPGEKLVLCSDGVTDYLGDTHPEAALFVADAMRDDDPYEAAHNLIAQANRGGGGDNITAVVARLHNT